MFKHKCNQHMNSVIGLPPPPPTMYRSHLELILIDHPSCWAKSCEMFMAREGEGFLTSSMDDRCSCCPPTSQNSCIDTVLVLLPPDLCHDVFLNSSILGNLSIVTRYSFSLACHKCLALETTYTRDHSINLYSVGSNILWGMIYRGSCNTNVLGKGACMCSICMVYSIIPPAEDN